MYKCKIDFIYLDWCYVTEACLTIYIRKLLEEFILIYVGFIHNEKLSKMGNFLVHDLP